jgi:transcription antitermination factor NusG
VHARSNFERKLARALGFKGVDYFLPAVQEEHRWKDRKKTIEVPVFPGYVFVRIPDRAEHRLRVLQTEGAIRILGQGASIEPIPNQEVESVRLLLTSGLRIFAHPFLREGARVRVKSGPLKDIEGVVLRFKNQDRLVLSVNLLAQSIAAEIDVADVEAV